MSRQYASAPERNGGPILEVLRAWLPGSGRLLEIACGTGQHAAYLAPLFPELAWQPTDADPRALASTDAWCDEIANVHPAALLDVRSRTWSVDPVDAIFCANMIHIAPLEACLGLLAGAGRALRPGGVLVLYGPFRCDGRHTAPSNAAFDANLRARDPSWGVRDLEFVIDRAAAAGLTHRATVPMPANNLSLVFHAHADATAPGAPG